MRLNRLAAAAAGAALAGLLGAAPAAADPAGPTAIAGSGDYTTQDVLNAIAGVISAGSTSVGSWNGDLPGTITPKNTASCTNIARPRGSNEGLVALRRSLDGTGCLDFARSSDGPVDPDPAGRLQWVPFGLDGVTMAAGPLTGTDATAIGGAFDLAELRAMYRDGAAMAGTDGVTYDPWPGDGLTGTPIHLLVPAGESFFAQAMGISPSIPPPWVSTTFTPTGGMSANPVVGDNGKAVQLDHNAIMPFSTAQWIAQASGHNDRRHGARLQTVNGIAPITAGRLNGSFPGDLLREVFNVIPFAATTVTGTPLYNVFVATNTLNPFRLCGRSSLITEYGFNLLTDAPKGHTCGAVAPDLRGN